MYWYPATEDKLSQSVGLRLLNEVGLESTQVQILGREGNGYLRKKLKSWIDLAQRNRVVLITDLDRQRCPASLRQNWSEGIDFPETFLLRVAVREIESWLLADHDAIRSMIGRSGKLPDNPDLLPDPKQWLLSLALSAPRRIRIDLVQETTDSLKQGFGYSNHLCDFVEKRWVPIRASNRSESLRRSIRRIKEAYSP